MAVQTRHFTAEEFDRWVAQPEHADRLFEYIGGQIIEVVSNNLASEIALRIGSALLVFVREKHLGRVTGADGGYVVSGERYIPDVAFISQARQPQPSRAAYNPNPPDLAVEVLSPSNDPGDMRIKVVNYLKAGTVVWVVDPERQQVEVYTAERAFKLGADGVLDGGAALPGFRLAVKDIFKDIFEE